MTTSRTTWTSTEYVIISKSELDIKKWEIFLNEWDIEDLLEYQDVFLKFLTKSQHTLTSQLWMWELKQQESYAYIWIEIIEKLKENLKKLENTYKQFKEDKEKKK